MKHWSLKILSIIALTILVIFLAPRFGLMAGSDSSLGLNSPFFLKKSLFAWSDIKNDGGEVVGPSFFLIFESILNFLGLSIANPVLLALLFLVLWFLSFRLISDFLELKSSSLRLIALIVSSFVVSNEMIRHLLASNINILWSLLFLYSTLYFYWKYSSSGRLKNLFFSLLFINLTFIDRHSVLLALGVIIFGSIISFLVELKEGRRKKALNLLKKVTTFFCLFLVTNCYWIINNIIAFFGKSGVYGSYFKSDLLTGGVLSEINSYNDLFYNIILSRSAFYESKLYQRPFFYLDIFASYFLLFLACSSMLSVKSEGSIKVKKRVLLAFLVFVFFLSLSLGPKNPLKIFDILWNLLPGFKFFRDFFKFHRILFLIYPLLGVYSLIRSVPEKRKKGAVLALSVLFASKFVPFFFFLDVYRPYHIPNYYDELKTFLQKDKTSGGLLIMPVISGMQVFDWSNKLYNMVDPIKFYLGRKVYLNEAVYEEGYPEKTNKKIVESLVNDSKAFCNFLSFRSIKYLVIRTDLQKEYLKKIQKSLPGEYLEVNLLRQSAEQSQCLEKVKDFGKLSLYETKDEFIFPHIYIPNKIVSTNLPVEDYLIDSDFNSLRNLAPKASLTTLAEAIHQGDGDPAKNADEIFLKSEPEGKLQDEEVWKKGEFKDLKLPFVNWPPNWLIYDFILWLEKINIWRSRNNPVASFDKYLFYARKRIAEVDKFYLPGEEKMLGKIMKNYRMEINEALKILTILEKSKRDDYVFSRARLEKGILEDQQMLTGMRLSDQAYGKVISIFGELVSDLERYKITHNFSDLKYKLEIPKTGEYQFYLEEKEGKLTDLGKSILVEGNREASLPLNAAEEVKLNKDLQIANYQPSEIYRLSFEYQNPGEEATLKITEGSEGDLLTRSLIPTGGQEKTFELFFLSSPEATMAAIRFVFPEESRSSYEKISLEKIFQPKLISALVPNFSPENIIEQPKIIFEKVNPTKYIAKIEEAKKPYLLVLSESFNSGWKVFVNKQRSVASSQLKEKIAASYLGGKAKEAEAKSSFLWKDIFDKADKQLVPEERHYKINGFANSWWIIPDDMNKADNYELVIEYRPQRTFYLGFFVSSLSWLCLLIGFYLKRSDEEKCLS